jgi:poly(A)-specific ribonuclease
LLQLVKCCKLDEDLVNDLTGFKQVFKLLTTLGKPIVGHNILQDLMIMINNFETALPESYTQYKALTNGLFPTIFDTKTIYYELRPIIPKDKLPEDHGLEGLFEYFKNGSGRHLVVNSTAIECNIEQEKLGSYHEAGWDSFCAGYVFLRMAYYNISQHYPKSKKFVSSEVISGLSEHKNRVNVIRGASSHVVSKKVGQHLITTLPNFFPSKVNHEEVIYQRINVFLQYMSHEATYRLELFSLREIL